MDTTKYTEDNSKLITIRIPLDLLEKVDQMCKDSERNRSEQIRFIIRKYIEIKEKD